MNTELQSFTSDRIYCAVDLAEQKPGDIDILNLGCKSFYIKDEADKVIAELEKKLDIYKRGWIENDKVNANQYAEIRKAKRALWLARAKRAHAEWRHWATIWFRDTTIKLNINKASVSQVPYCCTIERNAAIWRNMWREVECKCLAKAEEYK